MDAAIHESEAEPARRGGRLFAYGSLRFPEVVSSLLGRVPQHEPDSAPGWRAAEVPDEVFPALVAGSGTVPGLLLDGLSPREWEVLDAFEGPFYEARPIELASGRSEWTYVCADPSRVGPGDWSPERFARTHLAEYVRDCADWRQEFLEGEHPD